MLGWWVGHGCIRFFFEWLHYLLHTKCSIKCFIAVIMWFWPWFCTHEFYIIPWTPLCTHMSIWGWLALIFLRFGWHVTHIAPSFGHHCTSVLHSLHYIHAMSYLTLLHCFVCQWHMFALFYISCLLLHWVPCSDILLHRFAWFASFVRHFTHIHAFDCMAPRVIHILLCSISWHVCPAIMFPMPPKRVDLVLLLLLLALSLLTLQCRPILLVISSLLIRLISRPLLLILHLVLRLFLSLILQEIPWLLRWARCRHWSASRLDY